MIKKATDYEISYVDPNLPFNDIKVLVVHNLMRHACVLKNLREITNFYDKK